MKDCTAGENTSLENFMKISLSGIRVTFLYQLVSNVPRKFDAGATATAASYETRL